MISWLNLSMNCFWLDDSLTMVLAIYTRCLWMNFCRSISFLNVDCDLSIKRRYCNPYWAQQHKIRASMKGLGLIFSDFLKSYAMFLSSFYRSSIILCFFESNFRMLCDIYDMISGSELRLNLNRWVSKVELSAYTEIGEITILTIRNRASYRPPRSPSQSKRL